VLKNAQVFSGHPVYYALQLPNVIHMLPVVVDLYIATVSVAHMYADEGLCVDSCGTDRRADENKKCVECDGECPLKGTLSVL